MVPMRRRRAGRPPRGRLGVAAVALAAGLAGLPGSTGAHPHAWIDLTITAERDAAGRIVALRQTWRFDVFYTLFVLEDMQPAGGSPDDSWIDAVMMQNLENLAPYAYFTEVTDAAGPVPFAGVEDIGGDLADGHLFMTFTLLFGRPSDPAAGPVEYAVFDPSYYVEMRHADGAGSVAVAPAEGCRTALARPDPEPEWLTMAAAADLGPVVDSGLGRLFAERVTLSCEAPS